MSGVTELRAYERQHPMPDPLELRRLAEDLAQAVSWFVDKKYGAAKGRQPNTGDLLARARDLGLQTER